VGNGVAFGNPPCPIPDLSSTLGDYGGPIVQDTRFEAIWANDTARLYPKWMSYRLQVVRDASRSRPSRSRSEVLSLTRSDHGAVRQRPRIPIRREDHRSRPVHQRRCAVSPPRTSLTSLHPRLCGQKSLINSPLAKHSEHGIDSRSYRHSSLRSSSMATPKIDPSNVPVFVKSLALLSAASTTGVNVEFKVRAPDAFLKRPVPPVI